MTRHFGYVRVSTKEQNTSRQLEGIPLDRIYEDKISGVIRERPQLTILIDHVLMRGDTLHVHSIDRLARSLRHLQEIVERLTSNGITIVFHTENLTFDSNTDNPMSMLMLQLLGAIAQFERRISKTRQREGIAMTKIHGTKTGRPFGKQPLDMTRRDEAIALCKQGNNITQIATAMKLSRASIYKLLA